MLKCEELSKKSMQGLYKDLVKFGKKKWDSLLELSCVWCILSRRDADGRGHSALFSADTLFSIKSIF